MKDDFTISDKNIEELAKKLATSFNLDQENAMSIMYEEWDLVEVLFNTYLNVKEVHHHLVIEINDAYRIA
jgi:hypothetical protein